MSNEIIRLQNLLTKLNNLVGKKTGGGESPLSTDSCQQKQRGIDVPKDVLSDVCIVDGVFTSSINYSNGEILYFAMEEINENNYENWKKFLGVDGHQKKITDMSTYSPLHWAKRNCDNPEQKFNQRFIEFTGMSMDEYTSFINKLADLKKVNKLGGLENIGGGFVGFQLYKGNYIVYASDKPITGKFKVFPEKKINLKQYFDHYGSIIMLMSSGDIPDSPLYWNRGIFRMPKSFIDQNYKGISMDMHSFTALVAKKFWSKQFLTVSPVEAMFKVIERNLNKDDYWVDNNIPDSLRKERGPAQPNDRHTVMKIDALLRRKETKD